MRKVFIGVVGAALIATALVAAGCGSSGGEDRTKADYLADANTICEEIDADRSRVAEARFSELKGRPTVDQLQGFYGEFAPLFAEHVDRFVALEPPDDDQEADKVEAINDAFQHEAEVLEQAADDKDVTAELIRTDEAELHREGDALREEFGITAHGCVP